MIPLLCLVAVLGCNFQNSGNENVAANITVSNSNGETAAANPECGSGELRGGEAELLVADLYRQHDSKKSPFFQTTDRGRVDKFFTKSTADLIWKDSTSSKGEVGAIDFDPLYDTQDLEKKNFAVGKAVVNGYQSTLPVTYTNYGEKKRLTFMLKMVDGNWKIDDIKYDEGHTLLAILKETYGKASGNAPPVNNVSGEFEGTYRVGDTTCTVKPVKQAFEIRWAKGKGSEYFFYKEANVFESEEDKKGGRNEFRFDDENYNSGTFLRADGKTFPVSRAR
ncbi:MAG: DUF3828 domain-containing protein [Pyrinomonadaceae bacterium]